MTLAGLLTLGCSEQEQPIDRAIFLPPIGEFLADRLVESMHDSALAGQLIVASVEDDGNGRPVTRLTDYAGSGISRVQPGGIILFGPNIRTPPQVQDLIADLRDLVRVPCFVATDNEGGNVSRLTASPDMPAVRMPSATLVGLAASYLYENERPEEAVELARRWGYVIGEELRALGFSMNMAPVADVDSQDRAGLLAVQRRTFGTEPRVVGELVGAAVAGMQDAGVSAVLKHFPGQGAASLDPHTTRVELPQTREELEATDLVPFRYGLASGARAVMTAHVAYPAVTGDDLPATVSRPIIHDLLRVGMGYDGLVITDALNMDGIGSSRSEGELAIAAILAGADMILKPVDPEQVVRELVRAMESGMLPRERVEESVKRILRTKLEAGLFGPAPVVFHEDPMELLGAESHRAVVDEIRQVARLWRPQ